MTWIILGAILEAITVGLGMSLFTAWSLKRRPQIPDRVLIPGALYILPGHKEPVKLTRIDRHSSDADAYYKASDNDYMTFSMPLKEFKRIAELVVEDTNGR